VVRRLEGPARVHPAAPVDRAWTLPYIPVMTPLSVLDLSPIVQGGDAAQSLRNSLDLARHAERCGYSRYWLAEHHNSPGIASAATAVVIAHVAAGTSTIRVGAGGIMLPNHAPLMVAEQFGTLAALHPGRIDLGVGRAPGTDQLTARALRRNLHADADSFPQDVIELMSYFRPVQARLYALFRERAWRCQFGFWGRASLAHSSRPRWGFLMLSHRILRQRRWSRRLRSIAPGSRLLRGSQRPTSCWVSTFALRIAIKRRNASSARSSKVSSTAAPADEVHCRRQ
jgi:hypothetical protein